MVCDCFFLQDLTLAQESSSDLTLQVKKLQKSSADRERELRDKASEGESQLQELSGLKKDNEKFKKVYSKRAVHHFAWEYQILYFLYYIGVSICYFSIRGEQGSMSVTHPDLTAEGRRAFLCDHRSGGQRSHDCETSRTVGKVFIRERNFKMNCIITFSKSSPLAINLILWADAVRSSNLKMQTLNLPIDRSS